MAAKTARASPPSDVAKAARHAAIEPPLNRKEAVYSLVLVPRDGHLLKSRLDPFRQL